MTIEIKDEKILDIIVTLNMNLSRVIHETDYDCIEEYDQEVESCLYLLECLGAERDVREWRNAYEEKKAKAN